MREEVEPPAGMKKTSSIFSSKENINSTPLLKSSSKENLSTTPRGAAQLSRKVSFAKKKIAAQRDVVNTGLDSFAIDDERKRAQAYDYLCHIGEAKEWIEACIKETIPAIEKLDEALRNGITLAQLGKTFQPSVVKRIFEDTSKLQFRHSDNINYFLSACKEEGLPEIFFFELTDLYEKKNIPKVIYCIHAYSYLLAKLGKAPHIKNLVGKLEFSDEVLKDTANGLAESAVPMPDFGDIGKDLEKEMNIESEEDRLKREEAERLRQEDEEKERLRSAEEERRLAAAIKIQSKYRGYNQKTAYNQKLQRFKSAENLFEKIQARYKGKKARKNFVNIQNDYKSKIQQIIQIQAWWKGVSTRAKYKELRLKKGKFDPKLVQKFIHLLESGDDDEDEEKLVEELRGLVIQKIRENIASEANLNELDSKVALLVKNRISVQEVARLKSKDMRAVLAKNAAQQEKEAGVLTLKGNDKDTKQKKRKYEELFYLLQTQPSYLANLMYTINKSSGGSSTKFLEQVVLTLFGYAQNSREEYLFLQLMETSAIHEISEASTVFETLKDNPMFVKLVLQYTRGVKEREYLRDLLRPLLEPIMNDSNLDLDTDPISIYKSVVRKEEGSTGEKSKRPTEGITVDIALDDQEVNAIYLQNMAKLKGLTDTFLGSIIESVNKMPFGIRYIAMKMKESLKAKFLSKEHEKEINQVIGNILYYRYINPVIIAPEAFDVIETSVSPTQRKNLAEVAKTLHQISTGRVGNADLETSKELLANDSNNSVLKDTTPVITEDMNFSKYLMNAAPKFLKFLSEASTVVSSEEFFGMDEFYDSSGVKFRVYITPDEVVQVHHSLVENESQLTKSNEDPLKIILSEMGPAPPLGTAAKGPGSEIVLNLTNRFGKVGGDEQAPARKLLKETKKLVLIVIRFCAGSTLLDILEQLPSSQQEQQLSACIKQQESAKASAITPLSSKSRTGSTQALSPGSIADFYKNEDDSFWTLAQIKVKALENMAKLEEYEIVTKADKYQSMLDKIVEDMLNKHRRRNQVHRELLSLRKTMTNLKEKATFLDEATESYHNYIDSCMAQLNKPGKNKKAPLIFSKQYFHMQDLKKTGQVPKFGSFKYTASELHKKGVLISLEDVAQSKFPLINLTISSNEPGVFNMEVTLLGAAVATKEELRLEDLLQRQYNKEDTMVLFDIAKVNLNLLIFLINKKFYA